MKTLIKFSIIVVFLSSTNLNLPACTSFTVYSSEKWYGMNFDYPNVDIKFSIAKINDRKVFLAQFGSGGYIGGMNDSGLFTNYQMLYYNNGEPVFSTGENILSMGTLNDYSIAFLSKITEVTGYIQDRLLVPSWGQDLHAMYADNSSNALVVEPFGPYNGITPVKDSFLVMTNFPNYDFLGMDYNSVYGTGSDRYKTAYAYILSHKSTFGFNDGLETLRRTVQSSGSYPTQVSLLFDPVRMEIFFCMKRDFTKVWKISLTNETIETFSGFDEKSCKTLDATGVWSYELSPLETCESDHVVRLSNTKDIKIFPDPAEDRITISLNSVPLHSAKVEIINTEGRAILSKIFKNTSEVTIDLTGKPKGFYLVRIFVDGEILNRKFCLK